MDIDKSCIDTLLEGETKWLDFDDRNLIFKGTAAPKYGFRALSSELVDGFWPNLHRFIFLEEGKSTPNIDELNLIFKVASALWNIQNRVSVCYLLNKWIDFEQTCKHA